LKKRKRNKVKGDGVLFLGLLTPSIFPSSLRETPEPENPRSGAHARKSGKEWCSGDDRMATMTMAAAATDGCQTRVAGRLGGEQVPNSSNDREGRRGLKP